MAYRITCFTSDCYYKEILRDIRNTSIIISFHKDFSSFFIESNIKRTEDIFIIDSKLKKIDCLLFKKVLSVLAQSHSNRVLIITEDFCEETFQGYLKLGFSYILSRDVFPFLMPAIIKNIDCFLNNGETSERIVKYKSLQLYFTEGYLILKECKIFVSQIYLYLILILTEESTYLSFAILKQKLEERLRKPVSKSYVTVTISRINREVYKATGLRLIKNRYGFGYYLDI